MNRTLKSYPNKVNMSKISTDLSFNLKGYQKEFIEKYDDVKQKYLLKGYILAFEQGLGKTFTSLALMHGLSKDVVLIIAPKSTLNTVWKNEINEVFKEKQSIWVVGDKPKKAKFYIFNYESMSKVKLIAKYLTGNVGIIVDEIHNFRNMSAKRVTRLLAISIHTKCKDMLLMSGTPIKALGSEMIPILHLLDPLFDKESQIIFKRIFGLSIITALDILKNRMGLIMHRKMKSEVLKLPQKYYKDIKISIPDSDKYSLDEVKNQVSDYINDRKEFYKKNYKKYETDYNECINFVRKELEDNSDFQRYLDIIKDLQTRGYNRTNSTKVKLVAWANKYEKEVIRPLLTSELKKKFDNSKAVVKYVDLKIMGEVIGGLLNQLRAKMFSEMIEHSPLCELINSAEKKTICFTTFVDVVRATNKYVTDKCKQKPITVFGETSSNVLGLLKSFKTDQEVNPLIATIQTLSTGVTLVEADVVIFINQPWRSVDKSQAEDRVHRIGQDTDVKIYTFILDTGLKPNLSTRMADIVQWSKEMFEGIVGKDEVEKVENKTRMFARLLK
jgi:SNF2 family DNA or RNA helicase